MFPRVPSRSGGMVVVQTGILGTLLTGLFVSGARALAPEGERGYQAALSRCVLGPTLRVMMSCAGWVMVCLRPCTAVPLPPPGGCMVSCCRGRSGARNCGRVLDPR